MAITRGTRGAYWLDVHDHGEEPGYKVASIDTTGAGDAFMAGLLVGLVHHPELPVGRPRHARPGHPLRERHRAR